MRCRSVRRALAARELAGAGGAAAAAVARHLATCPACAERAGFERWLTGELAGLRHLAVPPIDVRDRVARRIAALGRTAVEDLPTALLGAAAAGSVALAALLVAGLWWIVPELRQLAQVLWAMGESLRPLAAALAAALAPLATTFVRLSAALVAAAAEALRVLEPAGWRAILAASAMMAATIALVVVRDFRRAPLISEEYRR
jgi:hypothetical protein